MVQLAHSDINTKEVLQWQGVHLFHFRGSSCSQKLRIYLNLKQLNWESHEISLARNENFDPWYLGINPRGLLPSLVVDGEVHIESNDILLELERRFPTPVLLPSKNADEIAALLKHEDDLHMDLRTLTFRYTQIRAKSPKSNQALDQYRAGGSGQVGGQPDTQRAKEIGFWETVARDGITDEAVKISTAKFRDAFDGLEKKLSNSRYLHGDELTVLDVAWYVYSRRLSTCGYPIARLHPKVGQWFSQLDANPVFSNETTPAPEIQTLIDENHQMQQAAGESLVQVTGY
jgi:glutathione S-transferase